MACDDTLPPLPPPTTTADKLIPFSITNKVPAKLSFKNITTTHVALSLKYISEASVTPSKMWILGPLCDSLQEQVISTPSNAKELWDNLKGLFHDNKDARAINLANELRSIKIGNMSINEYCTKIMFMADRLQNLGSSVSEKNLVIYAVNGLDSRFTTIVKIVRHREPLPSFEKARNMSLLEESTLNENAGTNTTFDDSSSSPTVLVTSHLSNNKSDNNSHSNNSQSTSNV
ncbi:hybrid signal transduction histidine kinase M [Artemisia annua]|uniref:Hybrid signal transduction histidine kinase M n=1 Tax=Artemisia annua TaxID=35608 RepID=A0A2U1MEJ9_ARTAN|nr:hybrid signal transduction histidine kinase M [Artemisia annua]